MQVMWMYRLKQVSKVNIQTELSKQGVSRKGNGLKQVSKVEIIQEKARDNMAADEAWHIGSIGSILRLFTPSSSLWLLNVTVNYLLYDLLVLLIKTMSYSYPDDC